MHNEQQQYSTNKNNALWTTAMRYEQQQRIIKKNNVL
jgi:hypothetical protein